ncbi:MAG: hypothetical protein IPO32_18010 [Crocinitomicaceae bacterium]|nr:hypothetical protein [Crocinitomicaceae bacterium]
MRKFIFSILILQCSLFVFGQGNFKYAVGLTSSVDLLRPSPPNKIDDVLVPVGEIDYEYFTGVYSNGYALNLGVTNKFNYKKLFLRLDLGYNFASQQQTLVFSNPQDLNISHVLRHNIPYCSFDWALGRDFSLKHENLLQLEIGLSTVFALSIGANELRLEKTGTMRSKYSDEDLHYQDAMAFDVYTYEIEYERPTTVSPFLKIGLQYPVGKNYFAFGINARYTRLVYENFIYLNGDAYSAVASSRSHSSSLGIYFNYQFGKKLQE